jgi:signal transduction histidine kinase/ligand-binding sensor domain-containing protein/DNA-binding NarL/FixJ family response regulator
MHLYAQVHNMEFEHLSASQGLVGNEVHCILQDSRGFMWFGTEAGLNRYDGYTFTVYRHEPGNPSSIVDAKVQCLWEDKEGILWIGTWKGLERFDRASSSFTHFLPNPQAPSGDWSNVIYYLREDRNGTLWAGGEGVKSFDKSTGTFASFRHDSSDPHSLLHNNVDGIYEDESGILWIGTGGGLERFDPGTKKFTHYWVDGNIAKGLEPNFYGPHWIQSIFEARNGILWLCTNGGPVAFDRKTGGFKLYRISQAARDSSNLSVSSACEDESGVLWIGPWSRGLMTYDARADSFVSYPAVVTGHGICSLYRDRGGNLWIGTNGDGVFKAVKPEGRFTPFTHDGRNPSSLSNNNVRYIYEDRNGISIGTAIGADAFNRRTGVFSDAAARERPYPITGVLLSRSGTLWTGMDYDGINTIRHNPYRRKFYSTRNAGLGGSACSFFEDRRGLVWMLINGAGVCQFDPQTEQFKNLGIGQNQSSVSARSIVEDSIDNTLDGWVLWIGTNDGLWRYDRRADAFTRFGYDPKDPASLSSNTVTTVFQDSHGTLWIGTDQGLNRMDPTSRGFVSYTESNGLPNNLVLGILEDDHRSIWVSTSKAISKLDPQTKRFVSYSMKSVLPGIRFGSGCCLRSTAGEMYFGGDGGFVVFQPDSIKENLYVPPLAITGFNTFDATVILDTAVSEKKVIELSYKDNVFSFEFAALSYTHPEENQYAYRLEGHDNDWIYCGNQQYARYVNVEEGKYLFRVRGSNNDGVWNEEGTSIAIIIAPPPWKTAWAYLLYVVVAGGALLSIRGYQVKRIRAKHHLEMTQLEAKTLRDVDQMKSRFFANISHEFRTPLTLILGPLEKWRTKSPDGELQQDLGMMERNAQRLLRLINQLLDLSKLEAGGMKLQAAPGNIVPFTRGIAQSFQSSGGRRNLTLEVESSENEIEMYFDHDKMEKIFTNLLSNAFKFTPEGGTVTVHISHPRPNDHTRTSSSSVARPSRPYNAHTGTVGRGRATSHISHHLSISVADTGIGIPPGELPHIFDRFYQVDSSQVREHEGTGIGLALTKELVELHRGEIHVTSEVGKGTEVILRFPLGKEHLEPGEIVESPVEASRPYGVRVHSPVTEPMAATPGVTQESSSELPLVLIVEDNADVRGYINEYLRSGYRVIEARNGLEGVAEAREQIPDLIISDVMMPKMDGYELCRVLKLDERTSHIPIVLLTAKAGTESKIEGLETGADDYLVKPFDAKELLVRVRNLIELRRKLRERFSASQVLKPGEIAVTSMDDTFLQKVMAVVESHIGDENFSVEHLGKEVGMSRSQVHRKLTALTGQAPSEFIRYMRLHRAKDLLTKKAGTVSEIAYMVGFSGVSYFTKCFQEQFGALPSEVKNTTP